MNLRFDDRVVWVVVWRLPEEPFVVATNNGVPIAFDDPEPAVLLAEKLLASGAAAATPLPRTLDELADLPRSEPE